MKFVYAPGATPLDPDETAGLATKISPQIALCEINILMLSEKQTIMITQN